MNTETGEWVTDINDGDKIVRAGSINSARELESAPRGERFSKLYHSIMPLIIETSLTTAEVMLFLFLASHLRFMSNVAKFENGKLITRDSLEAALGLSERTIKSSIYRLIKEGLIVETNTIEGKVFVVNPYVISVGDKLNKTIYDLFRKSKWARW
jgi:biotin operon repressor